MPKNPQGRVFIHVNKRPHKTLGIVIDEPGKWGKISLARAHGWDIYDFKKIVRKLIEKGLVETKANKIYPTDLGCVVYRDTFLHRKR